MSDDVNVHVLSGNLTRDPESKRVSDKTVATFTLAFNTGYGDRRSVSFLLIECWGNQADAVAKYCQKGSRVCVTGELREDRWTDKESNQPRAVWKIIASRVVFLGRPGTPGDPETPADAATTEPAPTRSASVRAPDDEPPF